jgi:hypothetical protein
LALLAVLVLFVAKSADGFAPVQVTVDTVTNAAEANSYLVWIAPGADTETVTMKPHVHVQGAGQESTYINSSAPATLELAANGGVRDLTVINTLSPGSGSAVPASAGARSVLLADMTAHKLGIGGDD